MRIEGVDGFGQRGTHRMLTSSKEVLELQIASIPLSVDIALEKALPEPQPPISTSFGKDGQPTGRTKVEDDPGYQTKLKDHSRVYTAAVAFHGLRYEDRIEWDTPVSETREFYEKILREMMDLGWTGDDLIKLAKACRALSNITPKALDEASKAFSQRTAD